MNRPRPDWRLRGALLLFWLVPAVMGTIGFVLVPSRLNPDLSTGALFVAQLGMWSGWAFWTVALWLVGDRLPYRQGQRVSFVVAHAVVGAAAVLGQILLQARLTVAFGISERHGLESTIVLGLRSFGDVFVVMIVAIVVAQQGMRWYADLQAERVTAARLGEDLAQAHLRALQAQLNPHFLFNSLNSIVTLIGREPAVAQQLVVRLADLLRATLRAGELQEVSLSQEMEFTRRYLEIELVRFADRLTVEWPSDPLPSTRVPAFALQPLVENALHHGIARQPGPGTLSIAVASDGDIVRLTVRDSGPGLRPVGASRGTGTALANLRARLARLHGDRASLEVRPARDGGVEAELQLPFRADETSEPASPDSDAGGSGTQMSRVGSSALSGRR